MKTRFLRNNHLFVLTTLLFIMSTFFVHAQSNNYKKAYGENINYTTGNKNGKDIVFDFACKYDVFFQEPIFSSRTKVMSEGNFIMYNGKRYTRGEIGNDIFDKIEVGIIDVAFDVYQGSTKITTVNLHNEISVSVLPGSPDWDDLWPGISETRAKEIWKQGYSIRNSRISSISFNGFYALESYIKKKESEEQARIEAEKKENERLEEEHIAAEKIKKEKEEQENLEAKKIKKETEEQERIEREEKAKQKQKEEELEQKRKEEQERIKQEKINAYKNRIEIQRNENNAIATSAAASSASLLYLLAGVIYNDMGTPARDLFSGSNFHINLDLGYGVSAFPMAHNSVINGINEFSGEAYTTEDNSPKTSVTIDLKIALKIGYEMEHGGINLFGRFEPGVFPLFTDFNTSYGYGGETFLGHKNIKAYGRYEMGIHNFSSNNWIDPEEAGEGGKTATKYTQLRAGLKVSYYGNSRTAKRDHLVFGIIENYFNNNSASIFSNRDIPDTSMLKIIDIEPTYTATGYFFEWKKDHTHRLYLEVFPNYPVTGEYGEPSNKGQIFAKIGFTRSIEGFFGGN